MKPTLYLIVALATLPLILSACGGGSGSSATMPTVQTTETVNGITVPKEPDPVVNNATLAGVDSNNNGVRDDVERKIAEKWPGKFKDLTSVAATFQKVVLNKVITEIEDKSSFCILANSDVSISQLSNFTLNNTDRYKAYAENIGIKKMWDCQ